MVVVLLGVAPAAAQTEQDFGQWLADLRAEAVGRGYDETTLHSLDEITDRSGYRARSPPAGILC